MIDETSEQEIEIADAASLPEHPVVSVQMLTYNHGAYVAQAIEGVLAQRTDFPFELLIAEDGSTDDTREIAMRYQRTHPHVIRIVTGPTNIGARRNRRRVARHLRGEFVAFCEGDDYWTDVGKLQRQVDWLRAHPEAGAVHTDFDHVLTRGGRGFRLRDFQRHRFGNDAVPAGDIFGTLLRGNFIQTCTLCVRAELDRGFLEGGFLRDSYPVGDWPLCLFIAANHEIGYLPGSTAVYRKVQGSMMNSGHAIRARTVAKYIPMIDDYCTLFGVDETSRTEALGVLYRNLFALSFFADDIGLLEQALDWLRAHDPAFLRPWQRRMKIRLARLRVLRKFLARKHEWRLAFEEWLRYKPERTLETHG